MNPFSAKLMFALLLSVSMASCKTEPAPSQLVDTNPRFDTDYLLQAGSNAVKAWYKLFEEASQQLRENGAGYSYILLDARDPSLYPPGAPLQPPSPATQVIVKISADGQNKLPVALILENTGYFELKGMDGGHMFTIQFAREKLEYKDKLAGKLGSVGRNSSGNGFNYVYYIRGRGNSVTPQQFDLAVLGWLKNSLRYIP